MAVAATTLVVYSLFRPLQRRVQLVVDRRFYRNSYDAAQVATALAVGLRDEVDPRLVAERWAGVVGEARQPAAIGYWIA